MPPDTHALRDRIGQLIMPRLEVDRFATDPGYAKRIESLVHGSLAGGFCIFGGTAELVANTIRQLQSQANGPLLFSCDCEFGLPMRLTAGGTEFPDAMAIAKTGKPRFAYDVGKAIGSEMRSLGLSWNFAPVADVNSNPANPIINTRAFGDDPETVAKYAVEFMHGLQGAGVAATAKHFPGHGDTELDSHRELPFIEKDWNEFNAVELPPFETLIRSGVDSVMTGHLAAPKLAKYFGASLDEQQFPATLSLILTTKLLREQLHFDGVIVTDALEMHAITKHFGKEEAAVQAFAAGADILLMPPDPPAAHTTIAAAVQSGAIPLERIRESLERIEHLQQRISSASSNVNAGKLRSFAEKHRALAGEIGSRAIELEGTLNPSSANVLIVADDRPMVMEKARFFANSIRSSSRNVEIITTDESSLDSIECDENTILAFFYRARGYVGEQIAPRSVPMLAREIAESVQGQGITLRGLILFGSPYLDRQFQTAAGFILKTFSESMPSIRAVLKMMGNE